MSLARVRFNSKHDSVPSTLLLGLLLCPWTWGIFFFFFWWDPNYPVDGCLAVSCSFGVLIEDQRRQWHPTPVLLPGKSHGPRSLVGCSPRGREESDTTEQLHFHFSLSCIGEGNGNPLQYSCLENPRDRGAWWAAICGVAQCRT